MSSGPLGFGINPSRTHSWQGNRNVNISAPTDVSGVISNRTQTIPARNIFRVNSRVYTLDWRLYGVYRAEFFQDASQNSQIRVFAENPPTGAGAQSANNFRFLPGENSDTPTPQDYTHLLSRVVNATVGLTPATGNQRNSVLIFGWKHKSLTSENIYRINEITQVAAVNTRNNLGIRVISGPGFTGGDLVRMDSNGSVSYNFTPANQQALQSSVAIRLRYACQGEASLRITFGNGSSQVIPLVSTTSSLNDLQYESFRFANVPNNVSFQTFGTSMTIQNISANSNVVLDRVELFSNIPIPILEDTYNLGSNSQYSQHYNDSYNHSTNSPYNQIYDDSYNHSTHSPYNQDYDDSYNQNTHNQYSQDYDDSYNQNAHSQYSQDYDDSYNHSTHSPYNQDYDDPYSQNTHNQYSQDYDDSYNHSTHSPYNQIYDDSYNQSTHNRYSQHYNNNLNHNSPCDPSFNHYYNQNVHKNCNCK
ncbi:delta endotoxin C-terminal domain-containing protein [Bacillus thuringiensis]|uniref:delta endotoxin C-terminal domain-containing protein n=1 Tax=Bacillus thuringiensis TaxID=1428 RepID=UPI002D7F7750|nr:delta endotoxin C-terminal domain-containing protein [Bacillus thuringiensis]